METSMNASRDLEFAIEWNRFILRIVGIWPDEESSKSTRRELKFSFILATFVLFSFFCLPQIISLVMVWGNLDLMMENLNTANVGTTSLLELIIAWYNGKVLKLLLTHVVEDWMMPKSEQERQVMLKNARIARTLCIGCLFLIQATLITFITARIIVIQNQVVENSTNFERELICQSYFPYDTRNSPNFELTCFGQCLACFYITISYCGIDTFITMLVLHVCAQFTNLRFALKNLVEMERKNRMEFRKKLAIIVVKHERLNRFAESMEESFNHMFLIQILSSTIQFCSQGYQVFSVLNSKEGQFSLYQLIFLIVFVTCILSQLFIYCYAGEKLNVESSLVGYAAYECEWYNLSVPEARDLMFVMMRSREPLQITAGKFCSFSFSLFCDILKTSLGYLSVLLTIKKQSEE
uniref:Odorant receptor n=1 Tax=Sirex noctilio TaxID=36765 RepID=A0A857N926_9HYME|nr:odorant receptor 20 [Sirex noctilio]